MAVLHDPTVASHAGAKAMETELLTLQRMSEQVLEEYAALRQAHDQKDSAMQALQGH